LTYVEAEFATRDTAIAAKADTPYVDSEIATRDSRLANVERVVTVDHGVTFNYLETGDDALVIRSGPNEVAANFLEASSKALKGRAVFYKDVLPDSGDLLVPTGDLILGATNVATELASKEPVYTAIAPLLKGFSFSSNSFELKLDETAPLTSSSFQTGKVIIISADGGSIKIQRFDDDGATITDAWQTGAQFRWDDSLGGSMFVDKIRSNTNTNVVIDDHAVIEADAVVNGTLFADNSNLSEISGVTAMFAKDASGIGFHTVDSNLALLIEDDGDLRAYDNLNVVGSITCSGSVPSPFWCAGKVNGISLAVSARKGLVPAYSVTRVTPCSAGGVEGKLYRTTPRWG